MHRFCVAMTLLFVACTTTQPHSTPSRTPSGSVSPIPSSTIPSYADWPEYNHDGQRSGFSSYRLGLGNPRRDWSSPKLDGLVYAQPLIVGDTVVVATENNSVYALEAASGRIAWRAHLGAPLPGKRLPCGNIDPSGITGTPFVDRMSSTIFVVANLRSGPHHELYALSFADGAIRWHRPIDPPGLSPTVEQERGALAVANGRVYVPFGGLQGDCGQYKGAIVSVPTSGQGDATSYVVPTARMGGIWNPGGVVIDGYDGDVWVTTGNSASTTSFDFGNAVLHLSPSLRLIDWFAPRNWAALNAGDVDLGSSSPVLLASLGGKGAPVDRGAFAVGKDGVGYLLHRDHLGHIGGEIASTKICSRALGPVATTGAVFVYVACLHELVGVEVGVNSLSVRWRSPDMSGPAILAADAVWALKSDGRLMAFDPQTGHVRYQARIGAPVSRFIAPSSAGTRLFVADGARVIAFLI